MSRTPPSKPDPVVQVTGDEASLDLEEASTAPELAPPVMTPLNQVEVPVPPGSNQADQLPGSGPAPRVQPQPVRMVRPGYCFNDRYVVERELGQGGMGKVFLARDENLGRHIAVKVIRPQDPRLLNLTVHREEYARAFLEEAKVGAELNHPNIAKVFDFGIDHGEPFTVFEYVEGETLKEMLARRGRLPLEEAQDIVAVLAQGLAYAHACHIVHRDLKPANIRITPQGLVKVLDLGLAARFRDQADWRYCGTPAYISPEQAASHPCDGRADQYALAVIAFELVTGRLPFTNPNVGILLRQHLRVRPPDPGQLVPGLPETVATAILCGLAKKPEERFTSCDDFAAALGCQVVRRSADLPQLAGLNVLTATKGPRLSAGHSVKPVEQRNLSSLIFTNDPLYLALTSTGLYVFYCEELTRWALTEIGTAKRTGALLTVLGRNGKHLQSFTFAEEEACAALSRHLHKLLASSRAARAPQADELQERRSVFLLPQRITFTHQTLGMVTQQANTKQMAQAGVQIQGHLLGADAVTEVKVERLPTFFQGGYRCSGIAVRAVDQAGRLELAANWLEQRVVALSRWMLASLGLFAIFLLFFRAIIFTVNLKHEMAGAGYFFGPLALALVPLFSILVLRSLRWPPLVRPTAGIVVAFFLATPLIDVLAVGVLAVVTLGTGGLLLSVLLLLYPLIWCGVFGWLFLRVRLRRLLGEYRRLLATYQPPASFPRRLGETLAWTVAVALPLTLGMVEARFVWENIVALREHRAKEEQERKAKEGQTLREEEVKRLELAELAELEKARSKKEKERKEQLDKLLDKFRRRGKVSSAQTHFLRGKAALELGHQPEAEEQLTKAVSLMEALVREAPQVIEYAVDLGEGQAALGHLRLAQKKPTVMAHQLFKQALDTLHPHLHEPEFGARAQGAALDARRGQAEALLADDKPADAVKAYDDLLELCPPKEQPWYRCCRARCCLLAGHWINAVEEAEAVAKERKPVAEMPRSLLTSLANEKTADAEVFFQAARVFALAADKETDSDKANDYAGRALRRLRQAVDTGFKAVPRLEQLGDFNALRSRREKEFRALIKEARINLLSSQLSGPAFPDTPPSRSE